MVVKIIPIGFVVVLILSRGVGATVIGYGAADSVLPAKNQELFYRGFELGLSKKIEKKKLTKLLAVDQSTDGSAAGAIYAAKRLLAKNVSVLCGFPTSHEALQVAPLAARAKRLVIFPSAGHSRLATFGPYVHTTGGAMSSYLNDVADFLDAHFKKGRGLFLYNPRAVFSMNQKDLFKDRLIRERSELKLDFASLQGNLELATEDLKKLKGSDYSYIFISMYPNESVSVTSQLVRFGIDLPIVTNSSWTTSDLEFVRRTILEKKEAVYSAVEWLRGSRESASFERAAIAKYGNATNEMAAGYDVGIVVGTLVERAGKDTSSENIYKVFHSDRCFDGTSVGTLCFSQDGGYANGKFTFVKLTKTGFVPVK